MARSKMKSNGFVRLVYVNLFLIFTFFYWAPCLFDPTPATLPFSNPSRFFIQHFYWPCRKKTLLGFCSTVCMYVTSCDAAGRFGRCLSNWHMTSETS